MSIELPVATRHRRDTTDKLLKATLNPNKQQQHSSQCNNLEELRSLLISCFSDLPISVTLPSMFGCWPLCRRRTLGINCWMRQDGWLEDCLTYLMLHNQKTERLGLPPKKIRFSGTVAAIEKVPHIPFFAVSKKNATHKFT